jgi:hypothetical protein
MPHRRDPVRANATVRWVPQCGAQGCSDRNILLPKAPKVGPGTGLAGEQHWASPFRG